eukprot:1616958-Rhodomonas_salina.1
MPCLVFKKKRRRTEVTEKRRRNAHDAVLWVRGLKRLPLVSRPHGAPEGSHSAHHCPSGACGPRDVLLLRGAQRTARRHRQGRREPWRVSVAVAGPQARAGESLPYGVLLCSRGRYADSETLFKGRLRTARPTCSRGAC